MRVGVISDTHIPERAKELPKEIYVAFKNVDLILHAGDLITIDVLESLKKICPVKAVYGNMDNAQVKETLNDKEVITVNKFKIGLMHGQGNPANLISFVKNSFKQNLDVIVFGHSHTALCENQRGVLYFNPGSPTDNIFSPYRSYGILEITDDIKPAIVRLA